MRLFTLALLAILPLQSHAQKYDIHQFKTTWARHKTYTLELLNAIPEEKFAYKPSTESRSYKELMLHIAQSSYGFSSMIVGVTGSPPESFLIAKTKEQVRQLVSDSFDFIIQHIDKVKDTAWEDKFQWGNRLELTTTRTRFEVLMILKEHASHHRGQLTVYLRLNGIQPPEFVD